MLNYPLTLRFDLLTVSGIGQHVRVTDSSRQEVAVAEQESLRVFPKWTVSVAGQALYVLEPGIRSMRITRLEDRETWWLERDGIILAIYRLRSATDEATLLIRPMNTLLFSAGCMSIFVYGLIGLALFFVLFSFRSPAREQALAILIVLLFATPGLCRSRVCGPVTDVAEQVKSEYGGRADFIHVATYKDDDVKKGLSPQVQRWGLSSEPFLFTINRRGVVVSRIEGAFSVPELKAAVRRALR